ncbi:hypothetical protein [Roseospira navarrensis]|uniref:Class I SAM-dependent methyltransferase n=1 Tax=Roseospira navarrensis TaxID=140058 RepID=A0A7X1ZBM0_9PROT|nr:hypothetical protein [Roseospira navarrensis]MQX35546.1 hypothetical protein [Roseospira navarrensis]
MIVEWIRHSLTPAPRPLRQMGYLRELIATDARRRRNRRAWQPHLRETHRVILDCAARLDRWDTVVVVGAGLASDIPLEPLALLFRRVVLVDLMFMPSVRMAGLRMTSVELMPGDITGVVHAVRKLPIGSPLPPTRAAIPERDRADLVVSCNVLSQLPLLPCRWLEARHGIAPDMLEPFRRRLIADHLDALMGAPCPVCLVTDTERQEVTADRPTAAADLLHGIEPEVEGAAWWWRIAPWPEESWLHDVRHRVVGGWLRGYAIRDELVPDVSPDAHPADDHGHGGAVGAPRLSSRG